MNHILKILHVSVCVCLHAPYTTDHSESTEVVIGASPLDTALIIIDLKDISVQADAARASSDGLFEVLTEDESATIKAHPETETVPGADRALTVFTAD